MEVKSAVNGVNCSEIRRLKMENVELQEMIDICEKDLLSNLSNNNKSQDSQPKQGKNII